MAENSFTSSSSIVKPLEASIRGVLDAPRSGDLVIFIHCNQSLIQKTSSNRGIIREARPAIRGVAKGFRPKIHELHPELESLTDEELEKLIGESSKFDFESD